MLKLTLMAAVIRFTPDRRSVLREPGRCSPKPGRGDAGGKGRCRAGRRDGARAAGRCRLTGGPGGACVCRGGGAAAARAHARLAARLQQGFAPAAGQGAQAQGARRPHPRVTPLVPALLLWGEAEAASPPSTSGANRGWF